VAEEIEGKKAQTPSEPDPSKTLVEEYDIESRVSDDSAAREAPAEVDPQPESLSSRPRGPDGRFLKSDEEPPSKPNHSKNSLRLAGELGFSQSEIESLSPSELDDAVYWSSKQLLTQAREGSKERTMHEAMAAPPRAEPEKQVDEKLMDNEEEYDPTLLSILKQQKREIADLKKTLEDLQSRDRAREAQTVSERIDNAFTSLGSEYESYFGSGTVEELDRKGPEYKRRLAVLSLVQQGGGKGTLESKIRQTAKDLFGERQRGQRISKEEWSEAALARPTQRLNANEPPGREKAIKTVAAIQREYAQGDGDTGDDEFL
jgi:hypothetical protein